ncbi:MAG: NAD(P)H-hydrate dehydratase [Clostridiales bacterium]|nr:NAD(P)H-hydrate dehydratase [Clostridiales bacterium]
MRTILTPQQMRQLETRAFDLGLPSLLVMEQAAREAVQALRDILGGVAGVEVLFLIGGGNNGGDGLAMARLWSQMGGQPRLLLTGEVRTPDARANLAYVRALGLPLEHWTVAGGLTALESRPRAVVDAVYGTGFHGSLDEGLASLFSHVNAWALPRVAVDVPSGLDSASGLAVPRAFHATHTLALGHLKTGHAFARPLDILGQVRVLPLHLPKAAYEALSGHRLLTALEPQDLPARLPRRAPDAHKGDGGRVLLYMGSLGLAGAAGLAAQAALACSRAGAGLVTLVCEPAIIPIIQSLAPGATCLPIAQAVHKPPRHDVLALGSGLGQSDTIWQNILALWDRERPSLWDADALNLLARQPQPLGPQAVMTPHPGEAARLLGCDTADITADPLAAASELQARYQCAVVLKGAATVIRDDRRVAVNLVGSPALAKGGSGDALAGIIAALMAQHRPAGPFEAARTGCLWHGLAGRLAARRQGLLSTLTTDVIDCLGPAALGEDEGS